MELSFHYIYIVCVFQGTLGAFLIVSGSLMSLDSTINFVAKLNVIVRRIMIVDHGNINLLIMPYPCITHDNSVWLVHGYSGKHILTL